MFGSENRKKPSPSVFFADMAKIQKVPKKTASGFLLGTTIIKNKNKPKKLAFFVFVLFYEFPGWPIKVFARRKYGFRIWGELST